jgi:hypothetical protein
VTFGMTKQFKAFIQYMIYGSLAILTLYISLSIKAYGFTEEWFESESLNGDGLIIWICLMMGLSTAIIKLFRHLFGKDDSII